jgi:predicted DNA-binding protein (MmcQ/YjbR family)
MAWPGPSQENKVKGPIAADWLREVCMAFPGAAEQIQWGCDLVFKVGGKMFAITPLEPAPVFLSFKASPENFAELTERGNIIPAPYLARAQWVALESNDAIAAGELAALLRESYDLVAAKLPQKIRATLSSPPRAAGVAKSHAAGTLARTLAKIPKPKPKKSSPQK